MFRGFGILGMLLVPALLQALGAHGGGAADPCTFQWPSDLADCSMTLLNFSSFVHQGAPFVADASPRSSLYLSFAPGGLNETFIRSFGCPTAAGRGAIAALLVNYSEPNCAALPLPTTALLDTAHSILFLNFTTGAAVVSLTLKQNTTLSSSILQLDSVEGSQARASLLTPNAFLTNPCTSQPCTPGSCFLNASLSAGFSCKCPPNYAGDLCQLSPCMAQPGRAAPICPAHARCVVDSRQPGGFGCACRRGYVMAGNDCQLLSTVLFAFYGDYAAVYPGHETDFVTALVSLLSSALSFEGSAISVLSVKPAEKNVVVWCTVPHPAVDQLDRDVQNRVLSLKLPYAAQPLAVNPESFCESTATYNCSFLPAPPVTPAPTPAPSNARHATGTLVFVAIGVVGALVIVMIVFIGYRRRKRQATFERLRMLARSEDDSASIASWENDT